MPVYKDKATDSWTIRAYIDGRQIKRRGFNTKQEAIREEARLMIDKPKRRIKMQSFMDSYFLSIKPEIKQSTYDGYEKYRRLYYNQWFGDCYIDSIDYKTAQKLRNSLPDSLSVKYKNNILSGVKTMFSWAIQCEYIESNPFTNVKNFKAQTKQEMQTWTIEQFRSFAQEVKNETHRLLFETLYWTGMRISEARGLQWECVDFKKHMIHVKQQYLNGSITSPKTVESDRYIDIDKTLEADLLNYKKKISGYDGYCEQWFVFGSVTPPTKTYLQNSFYDAEERASLPHIRIHDLRHSHASYLIEKEFSIMYISKRLGHANVGVTMNTYSHLLDSLRQKEAKKLRRLEH